MPRVVETVGLNELPLDVTTTVQARRISTPRLSVTTAVIVAVPEPAEVTVAEVLLPLTVATRLSLEVQLTR